MRILLLVLFLYCATLMAADPSVGPVPEPRRSAADVARDWDAEAEALRGILPSPRAFIDPEKRKDVAPVAIPVLRKAIRLNTEMYHARPDAQGEIRRNHYHLLAILAFLGDQPAADELNEARESNHKEIARLGRHGWYLWQWWLAGEDEKHGNALLDELAAIAAESPAEEDIAAILLQFRQEGCASDEQDARIQKILAKMTSPLAAKATAQFKAAEKRKSFVGKALSLSSTTLEGAKFTTDALRGKYIILHFGATWCGPWEQQHNQLLQWHWPDHIAVVTVLCDQKQEDVDTYVQRHNEIPWIVVRDRENPLGLAAQYGVEDFPMTIVLGPDGKVTMVDVDPDERLLASLPPPTAPSSIKPSK